MKIAANPIAHNVLSAAAVSRLPSGQGWNMSREYKTTLQRPSGEAGDGRLSNSKNFQALEAKFERSSKAWKTNGRAFSQPRRRHRKRATKTSPINPIVLGSGIRCALYNSVSTVAISLDVRTVL